MGVVWIVMRSIQVKSLMGLLRARCLLCCFAAWAWVVVHLTWVHPPHFSHLTLTEDGSEDEEEEGEEGLTWDELEAEAAREDEKRADLDEDSDEHRKRSKKRPGGGGGGTEAKRRR